MHSDLGKIASEIGETYRLKGNRKVASHYLAVAEASFEAAANTTLPHSLEPLCNMHLAAIRLAAATHEREKFNLAMLSLQAITAHHTSPSPQAKLAAWQASGHIGIAQSLWGPAPTQLAEFFPLKDPGDDPTWRTMLLFWANALMGQGHVELARTLAQQVYENARMFRVINDARAAHNLVRYGKWGVLRSRQWQDMGA